MSSNFENEIIGQRNLIAKIQSFTIDTFPHSLLLCGDVGCGKHLMCKYISDYLQLDLNELGNNISDDDVTNIILNPSPCVYFVDLNNAISKTQNTLLKLIEEPPRGVFIICITTSLDWVLDTLSNRCKIWRFDAYKKEELLHFIPDNVGNKNIIFETFNTPGKILTSLNYDIQGMYSLSENIIERIHVASISNILTITDKFAWKEESNKYPIDLFIDVLTCSVFNKIKESDNQKYIRQFMLIKQLNKWLYYSSVKNKTFDEFLLKFKEVSM